MVIQLNFTAQPNHISTVLICHAIGWFYHQSQILSVHHSKIKEQDKTGPDMECMSNGNVGRTVSTCFIIIHIQGIVGILIKSQLIYYINHREYEHEIDKFLGRSKLRWQTIENVDDNVNDVPTLELQLNKSSCVQNNQIFNLNPMVY